MTPASLAADFTVNVGGWSLYPFVAAASIRLGKDALRNFAFTLAEELKPDGILDKDFYIGRKYPACKSLQAQ